MMRAFVVAAIVWIGCTDDHRCPPPPATIYPAVGSGAAVAGELTTGAQDQRVVVSPDRRFLEYTFTRNGTTTTARYALSETVAGPGLYYVTIRRPDPQADCAALAGRGPVIDSVEVRRGGVTISDAQSFFSSARCGQSLTAKAPNALNGPPDGVGLALADSELGWDVRPRLALAPGDTVTVTVLDASGEAFDVYAARQQTGYDVKLGTLTGTGTVSVP